VFIVIGCKSTHFFLNKLQSHEKKFQCLMECGRRCTV
jgi:hypothetical protein